jgi:predicted permease
VGSLWLPAPNDPRTSPYPDQAKRTALMRELLNRIRRLPGVESAAIGGGQSIPLVGFNTAAFSIEGVDTPTNETATAQVTPVSPEFFRVLGAPIISGRTFLESDDGPNRSVVIDEAMARRYWKNENPIGRRIAPGLGGQPQWILIIGVVGTMKTEAFEAPDAPHLYLSIYQGSGNAMSVFVRAVRAGMISTDLLRREVEAVDRDLPVFGVRPMVEVISRSLARRRFALLMVGAFALVSLVLAGLGIYGMTAFSVAQRSRETGLRLALGAGRSDIVLMILRQGLVLTAIGLAAGLTGAVFLTRFLESLLFGTVALDLRTYLSVALLLSAVTMLAGYVPAIRALRVDPAITLRSE